MFRKTAAFLTVILILLTCCSCEGIRFTKTEQRTVEISAPPKVVYLGDSIAAGFGLEGYSGDDLYSCDSYANLLDRRYRAELSGKCGHVTYNDAISGDTSAQLLEHIRNGEFDGDLAGSDAVVVSIGGNDMLELIIDIIIKLGFDPDTGKFSITDIHPLEAVSALGSLSTDIDAALEGFESNLDLITDELSARTDGDIIIQLLYDPLQSSNVLESVRELSVEKIAAFNDIITAHAIRDGKTVYLTADVFTPFDGRSEELTNIDSFDIHPNAQGHAVIAEVVNGVLRSHKYSYTETVEVTDEQKTALFIGICIAAGVIVVGLVIFVIVRKVKK